MVLKDENNEFIKSDEQFIKSDEQFIKLMEQVEKSVNSKPLEFFKKLVEISDE